MVSADMRNQHHSISSSLMKQDICISRTKAGCDFGKTDELRGNRDVILQAACETRTAHRPHSTQRISLNNSHESWDTEGCNTGTQKHLLHEYFKSRCANVMIKAAKDVPYGCFHSRIGYSQHRGCWARTGNSWSRWIQRNPSWMLFFFLPDKSFHLC